MRFEELLDQAIDMLRRRGRVTYRALKLHFQLDDDTLDILKDELLYGQQLAVDEAGRVLVWAGPPAMPAAASSPPLVPQDAAPAQAEPGQGRPVADLSQQTVKPVPCGGVTRASNRPAHAAKMQVLPNQRPEAELRPIVRLVSE